jgi:hypothetical protein
MAIRIPQRTLQVDRTAGMQPQFEAQRVVPFQDQRPEQGQQLAQSAMQAGAAVQRVGDYLQDQLDDAASRTLANEYREQLAKLESQAKLLQGKAAIDQIPAIEAQIEQLRESFEERPENLNQRRMFGAFADERTTNARVLLEGHRQQQTLVFKAGALGAAAEGSVTDYQNHWQDPENGPLYKAAAIRAKQQEGALNGWDEQRTKNEVLEMTTKMHTPVVRGMVDKSPGAAAAYLAQHGAEIAPPVRTQLEGALQVSSDREAARTVLNGLGALPLPEKLKAIGEAGLPENVRRQALQTASEEHFAMRRAVEDAKGQQLQDAFTRVGNQQGTDLSKVFTAEEQFAYKQQGLWDDIEARAANGGVDKPFGIQLYALALDRPELLRGQSWGAIQTALAPVLDLNGPRMNTIQAAWAEANKPPGAKSNPQHTEVLSKEQFYLRMAEEAGVIPREKRSEKAELELSNSTEVLQFFDNLERDIARIEVDGKKATRPEIREIVEGYKKFRADVNGKEQSIATVAAGDALNASVSTGGQRVTVSEVLTEASEENPQRIVKPWLRDMVVEWNKARPDQPPLDPNNPVDAARVLAGTRAVEFEREQARKPERAARIAGARWQQLQLARQQEAKIRDLTARGVPPGDPEWSRVSEGEVPNVDPVQALKAIDEVVAEEWGTEMHTGWWSPAFGFSRARYEAFKLGAEKRIGEKLRERKIPFTAEDIRGRMR